MVRNHLALSQIFFLWDIVIFCEQKNPEQVLRGLEFLGDFAPAQYTFITIKNISTNREVNKLIINVQVH